MTAEAAPRFDRDVQAAFQPAARWGALFLWRSSGPPIGTDAADLVIQGAAVPARGLRLDLPKAIDALDRSGAGCSAAVGGYAKLLRFGRALIERGSARPAPVETKERAALVWRATLDADERAVLGDILRAMPPVAFAGTAASATSWQTARAFVDGVVDVLIRSSQVRPRLAADSWEGAIERGLTDAEGLPEKAAVSPRVRRLLSDWERGLGQNSPPGIRLVLRLDPPEQPPAPFVLSFAAELRDAVAGLLGPVGLDKVWAGALDAHLLVDDLPALRRSLQTLLHRAGAILAPVEASLASDTPVSARLSAADAWSTLEKHRAALEAAGARVEASAALNGIAERFPKPQVRLLRTDGASPETVTLAPRYRIEWQVATNGFTLTPGELRAAAAQAPLAKVKGVWTSMTAEAGERLARIAERGPAEWTGHQALAAALAGEVRLAGDLSDASVIVEPGLASLLDELRKEVEDRAPPPELNARLRHYQERGAGWVFHRTRLGLGALLADDMGLGKTVQLIAVLLLQRTADAEGRSGPTLVICPASLVGNWERELARFAPTLRVVRHHGDARHRDAGELRSAVRPHEVVLTTYALARRDAELLAGVSWGTVVCDEAQNIKNPTAAQAKAVRSLPASRRVALSGTPVENRVIELWGLMEFLNPGLLGPLDRFRREIALPLERDRDARALRWLRAATAPFILRRMKTDPTIAPELPEKETIRVFCSLTEEQARLYKEAVDESLHAIDESAGIERSGRVLRLLTALKQICNHPAHYLDDSRDLAGRSGKLDRAAEMIEEIVASDERVLVFTQYVEMGTRLSDYFARRLGIDVPFFHGGLALAARDDLVRRFQEAADGPPVLVLSLRAGGVGLNLTRATHVLHYDRWWNPATEDQATDRAHRIGQTRRVQVHHLITIGTLEERIDRMLEDKRGLADAVVTGGESWITQLSTDELRALVSLGSDAAVESLESLDAQA